MLGDATTATASATTQGLSAGLNVLGDAATKTTGATTAFTAAAFNVENTRSVLNPIYRISEDSGLTWCAERSVKAVNSMGTATAMATDLQMVTTYRGLLSSVGKSAERMIIDPSMPYFLENGVLGAYHSVWPEIEKEFCDRFILNNGFTFSQYRRQNMEHRDDTPPTLFQRIVGTLPQ